MLFKKTEIVDDLHLHLRATTRHVIYIRPADDRTVPLFQTQVAYTSVASGLQYHFYPMIPLQQRRHGRVSTLSPSIYGAAFVSFLTKSR